MRKRLRSTGTTVVAGALFLGLLASPAWAPHVAQLVVEPAQVEAGEEVTVFGPRGYAKEKPVEIRFGGLDGPVLATFETDTQFFASWGPGTVRIPADVEPGTYVLVATQELGEDDSYIRGVPARATIQVLGEGGAPAVGSTQGSVVTDRPAGVVEESALDPGTLAAIALGVAGVALFAAAMVALVSARRREEPTSEPVEA